MDPKKIEGTYIINKSIDGHPKGTRVIINWESKDKKGNLTYVCSPEGEPGMQSMFQAYPEELAHIFELKNKIKVYRYESSEKEVNEDPNPTIFLAGPTVRGNQPHLTSWRFECIEQFEKMGFDQFSLVVPEFSNRFESDKRKFWIPLWEFNGLKKADVILFWIPRTRDLIGLTTNFELGYWLSRFPQKVVYGRPDDAYRIDYLDIMWNAHFTELGMKPPKICTTLKETITESVIKANSIKLNTSILRDMYRRDSNLSIDKDH